MVDRLFIVKSVPVFPEVSFRTSAEMRDALVSFHDEENRPLATASPAKLNLKPLADRVIVKKLEAEEKTSGGIVLPETAKEKPQQGEVLAVGTGKFDEKGNRQPMELKVGDKVLFAKYSGTEVKIDGVEYLILAERDILAVFGA